MTTADRDLRLRIVLVAPPAGVDIGLQEGHGTDYRTVQTQRSTGADLHFDLVVKVRPRGAALSFGGPFAQGPAGARFVYLDIGTCAGQHGTPWTRRLKIPLSGIAAADLDAVLEARVAGTGRDGTPSCGTAKPFAGWKRAGGGRVRMGR